MGQKVNPYGFRLGITTAFAGDLTPGESVSVNGVCLTVVGNSAAT